MAQVFKSGFGSVYVRCHEAAEALDFGIIKEDISTGIIEFEVGMSLWSFGEKFTLKITSIDESNTTVDVASESALGLQIIAWNKNNRNISRFFDTLNNLLIK